MEPTKQQISDQLKRITESDQFARSNVNVSFLNLLVNSTIEGVKLKEATIGHEIFGKAYDPIKNDTKVRVYIHNLRKKLAEYYENAGSADELVFLIEKGQYAVSFQKRTNQPRLLQKKNRIWFATAILTVIIGVLSISYISNEKSLLFWDGYQTSKFPTTVLIGDHFTVASKLPTGGSGVFRDFDINSEQEFAEFIKNHPEQASGMIPNQYPYITKMGPYCTKMIGDYFNSQDLKFKLKLNSELDKSTVNTENLIYIGQFKTMGFFGNIFKDQKTKIEIENGILKRFDQQTGENNQYISNAGNETVDYTLVSRSTGPNGNQLTLFVSDNDIGVMSVVDYFTNTDSIASFYEHQKLDTNEFTAIFKVSGWERTGFRMSLISIDF